MGRKGPYPSFHSPLPSLSLLVSADRFSFFSKSDDPIPFLDVVLFSSGLSQRFRGQSIDRQRKGPFCIPAADLHQD
ncbi:hypothetical protein FJTKL_00308 [Diaporthe vaccinii]|uniref:Uncharacterized protein n=1 Tax=Diaporthe vaccinii TaxID=105482 RepID=A0ABR4E3L8_9PEZI